MSDLDEALARLERAVTRLEAASALDPAASARRASGQAETDRRATDLTAEIVARVEAALDKLGQALDADIQPEPGPG